MLKPSAGRVYDYNKRNSNGKNTWYLRIDAKALKEESDLASNSQEEI